MPNTFHGAPIPEASSFVSFFFFFFSTWQFQLSLSFIVIPDEGELLFRQTMNFPH